MRHDISYPPHCHRMRSQYQMRGHFGNEDRSGPLFLDVVQPALGLHTCIWDKQVPNFSAIEVHTIVHQSPQSIHSFKYSQNYWSDEGTKLREAKNEADSSHEANSSHEAGSGHEANLICPRGALRTGNTIID
jgi:hypothetical protein